MKNLSEKDGSKKRFFLLRPTILTDEEVLELNEFLFPRYNPDNLIKATFLGTAYLSPKVFLERTNKATDIILKESQSQSRKIYIPSRTYWS